MRRKKQSSVSSAASFDGLSIEAIAAKFNAKYGDNTMVPATETANVVMISTGVSALDYGLGGGIPRNRITEFNGAYSTLKTTVSLMTFKNFLAAHPDGMGLYLDAEHAFDPTYLDLLGVPRDRLAIGNPDSGEHGVDILTDFLSIKDRNIFVVIDSIPALVPMAELEANAAQQLPGLHARLINKLVRTANARLKRSMYDDTAPSATILALNQIREKVGVMFGDPEVTPGGRGKDFYYSTIVRFRSTKGDAIREDVERNGIKRSVRFGQTVRFSVGKNKVGCSQFEEGEFEYFVRPYKHHPQFSFNNMESMFRMGLYHGVIKNKGNDYSFKDLRAGKDHFFIKKLYDSPETAEELHRAVLDAIVSEERASISEEPEPTAEIVTPSKRIRFGK